MMESEGGIDRISNLPVHLLSDILSLLPTKTAIATSVLSTRWKFIWTSITNVDLNVDEVPACQGNELEMWRIKYTHYVNMVLRLLDPPRIQNFRLQCYYELIDPSCLNSWISFALGRTVRELDLLLMMEGPVELPLCLIYCDLVVLKLEGDILLNIPATASACFPSLQTLHLVVVTFAVAADSFVSFPSLKIMRLNNVKYADKESAHKLFSSCPVLDDLFIRRSSLDNVLCFIIRIPSLTRLTLLFENLDDIAYKVQLDTPALEYLNVNDNLPCEYLPAENLSSLVQAKVRVDFKRDDEVSVERCIDIVKFIRSLSKVKFLSVSGCAFTAIRRTVSANIPLCFHNLSRLKLELHYCHDLSVMISFLENMDNLEHLVFKGYWKHSPCLRSWWTEPLNVPNCLMWRVTTISFTGFVDDCRDQLSLLRYLLKNAKVLQLLTLRFRARSYPETRKLKRRLEKISMFPRGSETCQLKFHVESPTPYSFESDLEEQDIECVFWHPC